MALLFYIYIFCPQSSFSSLCFLSLDRDLHLSPSPSLLHPEWVHYYVMSCISLYLHILITYTLWLHIQPSQPKTRKSNLSSSKQTNVIAFNFTSVSNVWVFAICLLHLLSSAAEGLGTSSHLVFLDLGSERSSLEADLISVRWTWGQIWLPGWAGNADSSILKALMQANVVKQNQLGQADGHVPCLMFSICILGPQTEARFVLVRQSWRESRVPLW